MIVVIDNYDSFTYNLVDYVGKSTTDPIRVVRNDQVTVEDIVQWQPSKLIVSPGPKAPKDAGVSKNIIAALGQTIPILGVCLGHQAIAEVYGCDVVRAEVPFHGKTSWIVRRDDPLFVGVPNPFQATRYHSLVVHRAHLHEDVIPIAFSTDDSEIMAIKHRRGRIYGVQFHPESILTPEGLQIIRNFLHME